MQSHPDHLRAFAWYLPHQAWMLAAYRWCRHACDGVAGVRANLRGADLARADLRGADLTGADLTGARLTGANLRGARLASANLARANLAGADLTGADLTGARLTGANLTGADLTGVPVVPDIDAAILRAIGPKGEHLDMPSWHHRCGTAHCRYGWAIVLAGDEGRALEARLGPMAAGALIYAASGSHPVPSFSASNADAIADLRRRAGVES